MARPAKKNDIVEPDEDFQESLENVNDEAVLVAAFDEIVDFDEEEVATTSANDSKFTCPIEVRRKIEERAELKILRDELGFDDLD